MTGRAGGREVLGQVSAPSGVLVLGDMGYLSDWSGGGAPRPPALLPPESHAIALAARDWRIVGGDAEEAARVLDRQPLTYLYDIPDGEQLRAAWRATVEPRGLDARLVEEDDRVPHRTRAIRAARAGGAGFTINGVPFVALPVAAGAVLPVAGERSTGDEHAWRHVEIVLAEAATAATSTVGTVGVDHARLVVADNDALTAWVHEDSLDGLADVAFWGRDAEEAAERFRAGPIHEGGQVVHGWRDLPEREAMDRAVAIDDWREDGGRGLAVDFRPHSHHFEVMRQVRDSETESGGIRLEGAELLGFMTTWGDGFFDVDVDRTAAGDPARVRIVFER